MKGGGRPGAGIKLGRVVAIYLRGCRAQIR